MGKLKVKGIWTKLLFLFLILFMISFMMHGISVRAENKTSRVIRVGYFNLGDYYKGTENHSVDSYDRAYLEKLSEYTNLKYEYVNCVSWKNALEKLQKHEIDLVGTMQYSEERAEKYTMCSRKYGVTFAALASVDDKFIYEDYDAIGKAVIGCTKHYVRLTELKELLEQHHITPEIRYYDSEKELETATENGEVDLAACNSHALKNDWTIVEKYAYMPIFFATWKGNEELAEQIDGAILKLELYNGNEADKLLSTYFPKLVHDPFTKEEYGYIN